jgi:hypothetical protein
VLADARALLLSMRRRSAPSSPGARLHGFVSPELAGNFASMGLDPDQLFAVEIAAVAA